LTLLLLPLLLLLLLLLVLQMLLLSLLLSDQVSKSRKRRELWRGARGCELTPVRLRDQTLLCGAYSLASISSVLFVRRQG
jgi:hypothetical protein